MQVKVQTGPKILKNFEDYLQETDEVGYIASVVHSIVYISGLPGAHLREMVIAEGGQKGIVQSLLPDLVEVLMLDTKDIKNGLRVVRTNEPFKIPVSSGILGRVVNAFIAPVDGGGPIMGERQYMSIDESAPGLGKRVRITKPLETAVTLVDLLVPIGYGQRELVVGDKKTGKTVLLLQLIANQASKGTICVYVSIGKRQSDVRNVENYLKKVGVMNNCVLLVASSADPATMVYLAPFSGFTIAEFFRDSGHDVIIVLDDLSTHAKFYREISLLSKRAPGRASYPGDIFHLHAALLERAGNIKGPGGGTVSITALPVAETLEGDLTGYIQTNLMAMTDGHIFFDIDEFRRGARPAINHALSVSRVGNQTKTPLEREIAQELREALLRYKRDQEIARFGVELPETTRAEIDLGEKIEQILNQDMETLTQRPLQLILVGLLLSGFWRDKNASLLKVDVIKLVQKYNKGDLKGIVRQVVNVEKLDDLIGLIKINGQELMGVLYA